MPEVTDLNDPRLVKAMAHPLRVAILIRLQDEDHSPTELADLLGAPLGNVSYHVRQLAEVGLIKLVKKTPRRGAIEHTYRALPTVSTVTSETWAKLPRSVANSLAGKELGRIGEAAAASATSGGFDRPEASVSRRALRLDAKGWAQVAKATEAFEARIAKIAEANGDDASEAQVVTLVFENRAATPQPRAKRGRPATRRQSASSQPA